MIPNGSVTPPCKMASQVAGRTRALGFMRHSSIDTLFPPLGGSHRSREVLHAHGNAMSVAPARLSVDRTERLKMVKTRRTPQGSITPTSSKLDTVNKELREKTKELKAALVSFF